MHIKAMLAALAMTGVALPALAQDAPPPAEQTAPGERAREGGPRDGERHARPPRHSPEEMGARMFDRLDENGDGSISREEFNAGMTRMHEQRGAHADKHEEKRKGHMDRVWRDRGEWNKTELGEDMPSDEGASTDTDTGAAQD